MTVKAFFSNSHLNMEVHRGEQYRLHDHNDIGVSEWLITSSAILVSAHQDCAQMTAVNETIAKTVVKKSFLSFTRSNAVQRWRWVELDRADSSERHDRWC